MDNEENIPTLEGFIDFIKAQPADAYIDHGCGWRDCAVGAYAATIDCGSQWAADVLEEADPWLHELLNSPTGYRDKCCVTYAGLLATIADRDNIPLLEDEILGDY